MPARILIVEDETLVAFEMTETLSDYGYDCVGVADDTASAMRLGDQTVDVALIGEALDFVLADRFGVARIAAPPPGLELFASH